MMAAQSDQTEMLTVASRIASICRQAQSKTAYSHKEKALLRQREGEILDAASALSVLISGGIESKVQQEVIFRAAKILAMSAFDAGMITHTSDASKKFHNAKNTEDARKAALGSEVKIDEMRRREAAIVDALLSVSDSDWEGLSNHTIAKSVEGQAGDNFRALGGDKGPDRKTIQRWIDKNIRESRTR
jgi:hypothetical protein